MSSKNIKVLVDTSPYIPDIDINNKTYFSFDKINTSSVITTHQTIFIFNLQYDVSETNALYDNPKYMLYGIEDGSSTYYFPSLLYFQPNSLINPYNVTNQINTLTPEIDELLQKIGYDTSTIIIPTTSPFYQEINVTDAPTGRMDEIIFIFFYVPSQTTINYNNYLTSTFYQQNYWNVLIYPFVTPFPSSFTYSLTINFPPNVPQGQNSIENIYFDNRDLCEYINKIDYKYMEEPIFQHNMSANLEKLNAYSKNLTMFDNYTKHNAFFINLNEVAKIQYTDDSLNTYTNRLIFNKHFNNTAPFNNTAEKDSLSLDNKLSYVNNKRFNANVKYTPFSTNTLNLNTMYQISKNYYANCYVTTTESKQLSSYLNIINLYLHKLFVLINPNIIDDDYKLLPTTQFIITNMTSGNNEMEFGSGIDKDKLHFINSLIATDSYYINIYRILFKYNDSFYYIIILTVAFYNSNKIHIVNVNKSLMINDLGFSNITFLDETLSLVPCIFSINEVNAKNLSNITTNGLVDWKHYFYLINYNTLSLYKSDYNNINVVHFYDFVSNVQPNIYYEDDQFIKHKISNVVDVNENKVNNLVQNILMLNNNWNAIIYNVFNVKTIFMLSLTLDTNIIEYYISEIEWESVNISYDFLPSGKYKVLKYHNHFPVVSPIDDSIANSVKTIHEYTQYNYCILIKIPSKFECCARRTKFYIALCQMDGSIYVTTDGNIVVLELFKYYNHNSISILPTYQVIFNILTNTYVNFYQINIVAETFNTFTEMNTLLLNYNKLCFHEHDSKYMQDIIQFDRKRFIGGIRENNYYVSGKCECNFKSIILLFNLLLLLKNSRRILFYLRLCKMMKMGQFPSALFNTLINLVVFNANKNLIINLFCYYLRILYATNSTFILIVFTKLSLIDNLISLEQIVNFIHEIENVIYYLKWKIRVVLNQQIIQKCFVDIIENVILQYLMNEYLDISIEKEDGNTDVISIVKYNYNKLEVIKDILAVTPNVDVMTAISGIITAMPDDATIENLRILAVNLNASFIGYELMEYVLTADLAKIMNNDFMISRFNDLYAFPTQNKLFNYFTEIKTENNDLNDILKLPPVEDDVLMFKLDELVKQKKYNINNFTGNFMDDFYREFVVVNSTVINPNNLINEKCCCKILNDNIPLYYEVDFVYVNFNNPEI